MIEPITTLPITLFDLDDFDLQLNWRVRCGATFSLSDYHAKFTLWPSKTDRTAAIYQITDPFTLGNGITLADTSPNIWVHILAANVDFSATPPKWYILELQTPPGVNPATDGVWFRLAEDKVIYKV